MDNRGLRKENRKYRIKVWHVKGANPNSGRIRNIDWCGCFTCKPRMKNRKIYRQQISRSLNYLISIHSFPL